jgi:hypothetical protein
LTYAKKVTGDRFFALLPFLRLLTALGAVRARHRLFGDK